MNYLQRTCYQRNCWISSASHTPLHASKMQLIPLGLPPYGGLEVRGMDPHRAKLRFARSWGGG